MPMDNLSAVLYKKNDLKLVQLPFPKGPGRHEVLLATHSVGICGSDVHYWTKGAIGNFVVKEPMILGHETSALVVRPGEDVTHIYAGDHVAVEPGVPCRRCNYCKEGKYNLCKDVSFFATPPHNGTLTRYFIHAADFCFKLPENVSFEEGAMLEPLSVAVHACNRAEVKVGSKVLVCGAGTIGFACLKVAKAFGASQVCVVGGDKQRLEFAKSIGADHTLLLSRDKPKSNAESVELVKKCLGGRPNITIECSGTESRINLAISATESGGTVQLVGMGPSEVKVPLLDAICREVDIRGVFRYRNCYPQALELVASGKVDLKPFITHRFKLEAVIEAFEAAKSGKAIKVMIHVDSNMKFNEK